MIESPSPTFRFLPPVWHDSLPSTSSHIRERQRSDPLPSGSVIAARIQTAGRGRMGNAWFSPPGRDLTFSFLWKGESDPRRLGTFSLVCGLAMADYLASLGLSPRCKWPNDILVGGGKICGILCEASNPPGGGVELTVGIGLNLVRDPGRDQAAGRPVACLADALGRPVAADEAFPPLLACLEKRINAWMRHGFAAHRDDYAAIMWGVGERARVRTGAAVVTGVILGVGDDGRLLVRDDAGQYREIGSAVAIEPEEGHRG